jgi:glycosyltransferase involved in cell wall biosynthesis
MLNQTVTIVTPTTGTKYLKKAIESVQNQTYKHIQHLIVIDGKRNLDSVSNILLDTNISKRNVDVIPLPYPTGTDRYNGHRIYGASIYLCKGDFICFLDEDNWFDENHVETLLETVQGNQWAFSLRKIVDADGNYVCNDDCESLGNYSSVLNENDYFVDVGCFFLPKEVALQTSPIWFRKAREPGVPEVDRFLTHVLRTNNMVGKCSNKYSLNYRAGNTERSVKKEFFLQGNDIMKQKYNGVLPWNN